MTFSRMVRSALVVMLLFCYDHFAGKADAAMSGSLVWEKDSLEFKPAPGTKEIHGAFRFTNQSQAPVVLSRVMPNCGCLKIASFPKETAAGESGAIEFTYKAAGKEGLQTARIEVQFGDAVKSSQTLRLRLELSPRVSVRPGLLIWEKSNNFKEVAIAVIDPALTLNQTVTTTGDFRASLAPTETTGQFRLRLERPTKHGRAEGWATLTFSDGLNKPVERKIRLIAD